jgi:predicted dehydrogenase
MHPTTYGIVGFGGIAQNRIAREGFGLDKTRFAPDDNLLPAGACDVNQSLRSAAEALGIPWFESYEAMLADDGIEAVYVATSNATHFAVARAALEAG